jgi:type I restriction enzyme S subunit
MELAGGNIAREVAVVPVRDSTWQRFLLVYLTSHLGRIQMTLWTRGEIVGASIVGSAITLPELRQVRVPKTTAKMREQILCRYEQVRDVANHIRAQGAQATACRDSLLLALHQEFAQELGLPDFPQPWGGRVYVFSLQDQQTTDRLDPLGANRSFDRECACTVRFMPLRTVCEVIYSNEQIPTGLQRYLAIEDLPGRFWDEIEPADTEVEESTARKHFLPGDIAWAHLKPSILQGKAFIVREECWGSHHFLRLCTSKLDEDLRFLIWAYLKLAPIMHHLANRCTGKSESQKDVNADELGALPFPDLKPEQIRRLAERIRQRIAETRLLLTQAREQNQRADRLLAAKANIFDLLDDSKFARILALADEAGGQP